MAKRWQRYMQKMTLDMYDMDRKITALVEKTRRVWHCMLLSVLRSASADCIHRILGYRKSGNPTRTFSGEETRPYWEGRVPKKSSLRRYRVGMLAND